MSFTLSIYNKYKVFLLLVYHGTFTIIGGCPGMRFIIGPCFIVMSIGGPTKIAAMEINAASISFKNLFFVILLNFCCFVDCKFRGRNTYLQIFSVAVCCRECVSLLQHCCSLLQNRAVY